MVCRESSYREVDTEAHVIQANLVLQETIERIFVEDVYADIVRGIYLVRGENVLLLGEIVRRPSNPLHGSTTVTDSCTQDLDKDDYIPEPFRKVSAEEVHALKIKQTQDRKQPDKIRAKKLQELGFEAEHSGEILF